MRRAIAGVLVAAACQGRSSAPASSPPAPALAKPADAAAAVVTPPDVDGGDESTGSGSAAGGASETPEIANGGDSSDDADAIAKSATSAWQAVVDRDLYLARREQKGVIAGRVGDPIAPPAPAPAPGSNAPPAPGSNAAPAPGSNPPPALTWLIDDTEADGCLAIRVAFGSPAPRLGSRVALAGAWVLDDARHWYWKVASATDLPAGAAPPADPSPPGHVIAAAPMPADARPVSRLGDGNGAIAFQLIAPPRRDGDGWMVATQLGDTPVARLVLPGERPSYGGHDLRTADERWQLKRAVTYWVRVGPVRKPRAPKPGANPADALPVVHALGAPRRAT